MVTYKQLLERRTQKIRKAIERQREMQRLRKEGKTLQEIGDAYGLTRARVSQILQMGEQQKRGHAILTQQQVAEINDRRARGQTVTQIARCMKVSIGSVRGVVCYGNGARTLEK